MFLQIFMVFLLQTQTTDLSKVMEMDSFKRAAWCKNVGLKARGSIENLKEEVFIKIPNSKIEWIRNFLELKGCKLPSISGWFSTPKASISINEIRKANSKKPEKVLDVLLRSRKFADDDKNLVFAKILKTGCILNGVWDVRDIRIPELFHNAAFDKVLMIHRSMITSLLQKMDSTIILHFLPWTKKWYNKDKYREKFLKTRYAKYILSSTTSGNPRIALNSSGLELKIQLINLFGKYREPLAINPLLNLSNSDEIELRDIARKAIFKYFEGKWKKTRVGTVKLAGGEEKVAILYLNARQQAYHAVKSALETATFGDYNRTLKIKGLTKQLFAAWDKKRSEKWIIVFSHAYGLYKSGKISEAADKYMEVLSHQPDLPQKTLMSPVFKILSRTALANGDMNKAMFYLKILLQISSTKRDEADYYYLLGLKQESQNNPVYALHWYKMALKKDSSHIWASAAIIELDRWPNKPVSDWEKSTILGIFVLLFILAMFYLRPVFPKVKKND
jgi:tetratricopeptide (TPR) repeat protein